MSFGMFLAGFKGWLPELKVRQIRFVQQDPQQRYATGIYDCVPENCISREHDHVEHKVSSMHMGIRPGKTNQLTEARGPSFQAMISDTSTNDDRAKKFGILSSAFGFGFVIGPALGGLLSKYGMQVPFYFAAGIALLGALAAAFLLKETNDKNTDLR